MSIKIYEAYRVREGVDPFDLLWDLKRKGQLEAKKRLAKIFQDVLDGRSQEAHEKHAEQSKLFTAWVQEKHKPGEKVNVMSLYLEWAKEHCPPELRTPKDVISVGNQEIFEHAKRTDKTDEDKPNVFDIDGWMLAQYGETLAKYEWNVWALDATITVRRFENRYYLIPYCDRRCHLGGLFDFLDDDERLEDYAYWNNTDRPERVEEEKWEERSRVWNHLTKHDVWPNFLGTDVVSWAGWSQVSPSIDLIRQMHGEELEWNLS